MSYQNDLKYANDVLRIRDALLTGELNESNGVYPSLVTSKLYGNGKMFHILEDGGKTVVSEITHKDDNGSTILTKKLLVHVTNVELVWDAVGEPKEAYKIQPGYDEAQHFQDTLILPLEFVRNKTMIHHLHTKAMPPEYNRFKIYIDYIPILLAKLDGTNNDTI